ncbi:MAG: methyltransferase domain-containing protein [Pirellulales bacterium]|nr:methyltransferase domain-containing protein [Pirellulales bacterium]
MNNRDLRRTIHRAYAEWGAKLGRPTTDEMALPSYLQGNLFSRRLFWRRLRHVIRLARCVPETTVFDFGCGSGVLLPRLATEGRTVLATDLHPEIARRVADVLQLPNTRFVPAEGWRDLVPDRQVETIIAADVLEHIEDRKEILAAFGRKLTSGGRIVICGPTENWLYRLGRRIVGFSGDYHVTTVRHVFQDAAAVGLRQVQAAAFPLPGPACLFRIAAFARPS